MWTTLVVQPLYNLLVFLYSILGRDLGLAIIVLTLIIRMVLAPLSKKALKGQVALQELQPKLKELQQRHRGNREALARATMQLYAENKVNPLSSCLPTLIQLPFLLGIYGALSAAFAGGSFELLYPFVVHPGELREMTLGFLRLGAPSIPLAVIAGASQYWVTKMLIAKRPPPIAKVGGKDEDMMAMVNKQMIVMMPIMTVVIGATLPAGLTLYWFVTTIFQGIQQRHMLGKRTHQAPGAAPSSSA